MRRYLAALLMIILVITVVGCSKGNNPTPKPSVTEDTDRPTRSPAVESPDVINPEKPAQTEIVGLKANASGTLLAIDEKVALPNYAIEGCYYYDNERLVVIYRGSASEFRVAVYNIYSGEIERSADFNFDMYVDQCIVSNNGNIFISSTWGNMFLFLDKDLNVLLNSENMSETFSSAVAAYDGSTLYYLSGDNNTLHRYNVTTKVSSTVTTFSDKMLSMMLLQLTEDDQYLTVQYSDSTGAISYMIINVESKEILDLGTYSNNLMTSGTMYSMADYDYISKGYIETFDIKEPRVLSKKYFADPEEGTCFQLCGRTNTILSVAKLPGSPESTGGGTIRLYDAENMQVLKKTEIDKDILLNLTGQVASEDEATVYYYINPSSLQVAKDKNTALIIYSQDAYTGVMLWNLAAEAEVSGSEVQGLAFINNDEISAEDNDQYAQKIKEEYGVNVIIRDKVVRYFPDFAVNALYDENITNEALKLVEEVLGRYPKGFFKELIYDDIKSFNIYLCGTLVQGNEYGISNPGGFALQYSGSQMIIMDINYTGSLRTMLNHEIMHAIESKMDYLVAKGKLKSSIYENWNKFNPKKHDYRYSYVDENGVEYDAMNNSAYTPSDEKSRNNVDNIYYIDYYANTFPNEDRARIFENLMTADTELSYEFNSKHLKAKAVYLSKMIRTAFKSVPDDELMYWERFLGDEVFKTLK